MEIEQLLRKLKYDTSEVIDTYYTPCQYRQKK